MTDIAPGKNYWKKRKNWKNYCYQPFSFEGPFLSNTVIKKCSKESNKNCLEITEGSLLFHCQNRQNAKVNRCGFYSLKWIVSVTIFFPLFLLIVSVFWEECRLSLLPLGRPQLQCLRFEDSLPGVFCFFAFVKIWDCSISGRELLNFKGHNQDVFTCMFSPDDSHVVSCSADKTGKVLLQ